MLRHYQKITGQDRFSIVGLEIYVFLLNKTLMKLHSRSILLDKLDNDTNIESIKDYETINFDAFLNDDIKKVQDLIITAKTELRLMKKEKEIIYYG